MQQMHIFDFLYGKQLSNNHLLTELIYEKLNIHNSH